MISVVMPIKDRADLLNYGLKSIRLSNFDQNLVEIIVVDVDSNDNPEYVCDQWEAHYVKINPRKCDLPVPNEPYINPCLQQNVGIKMAGGQIIILTSPEVVFAKETLSRISDAMVGEEKCIYAEVFEPTDRNWFDALESPDWTTDNFKALPHGIPYNYDVHGGNKLSAYFLGAFWRDDIVSIGGIDEDYIRGIAWEDDDFGLRMAAITTPEFRTDIVGVHLPHPRSYQVQQRISLNEDIMKSKGFWNISRYIDQHPKVGNYKANVGRNWGSLKMVERVSAALKDDFVKLSVESLDKQSPA